MLAQKMTLSADGNSFESRITFEPFDKDVPYARAAPAAAGRRLTPFR
jgi:hypothetical protein